MIKSIDIAIVDNNEWEPDEDFLVELYDANTDEKLEGSDTMTTVTIIDDDKPGMIAYAESKTIKAVGTNETCDVKIIRKNGSDGTITVDFTTV